MTDTSKSSNQNSMGSSTNLSGVGDNSRRTIEESQAADQKFSRNIDLKSYLVAPQSWWKRKIKSWIEKQEKSK